MAAAVIGGLAWALRIASYAFLANMGAKSVWGFLKEAGVIEDADDELAMKELQLMEKDREAQKEAVRQFIEWQQERDNHFMEKMEVEQEKQRQERLSTTMLSLTGEAENTRAQVLGQTAAIGMARPGPETIPVPQAAPPQYMPHYPLSSILQM